MRFPTCVVSHILITVISMVINRRKENKEDKVLYIGLMVGGFMWSQLQTEYLIRRINKRTEQIVRGNSSSN
ncbi:hypothetical protein [Halalkalibacter okhensis]|uniref:Uncharacterized protein n=1 Tax=Halalkalibacter okhensis TaxID=333138 RepID=A0A0B0IDS4_9BACI|nr:hypothetical protein [Halalkalibacter okhensis]KHF40743.1 hypothetical protein LQ50_08145 [Halalkalibacter okhensis]